MDVLWPFDEKIDERLLDAISVAIGYGITVEEFEEALTLLSQSLLGPETGAETVISNSKSDLEIFDQNGRKEEKVNFSGQRIKRGLYRSGGGLIINADVNGTLNILRRFVLKEVGDVDLLPTDRGFVFNPIRISF